MRCSSASRRPGCSRRWRASWNGRSGSQCRAGAVPSGRACRRRPGSRAPGHGVEARSRGPQRVGRLRRCSRSWALRRTKRAASDIALPSRAMARSPVGPANPGGQRNDPSGDSMNVTVTTSKMKVCVTTDRTVTFPMIPGQSVNSSVTSDPPESPDGRPRRRRARPGPDGPSPEQFARSRRHRDLLPDVRRPDGEPAAARHGSRRADDLVGPGVLPDARRPRASS